MMQTLPTPFIWDTSATNTRFPLSNVSSSLSKRWEGLLKCLPIGFLYIFNKFFTTGARYFSLPASPDIYNVRMVDSQHPVHHLHSDFRYRNLRHYTAIPKFSATRSAIDASSRISYAIFGVPPVCSKQLVDHRSGASAVLVKYTWG